MNSQQKLKLSEMIKEYGSKDMTENIRKIKHSSLIKKDVDTLLYNIKKGKNENECIHESNFLFSNYSDIFDKIYKKSIDISILYHFIDMLRKIELSELNQHEASYQIGSILKEMYIDTKLNNTNDENDISNNKVNPVNNVGWKEYKLYYKK
jgi:hypothetical protein